MKAGWHCKPLSELATLHPHKREVRQYLDDAEEVSFVPMDRLNTDQKALSAHETRQLSSVYSGYTYFRDGDVLLAKITPCFENGKLGVAGGLTNGVGFGSSEFFVIRPSSEISAEYIYYFLNQQSFRDFAKARMSGAVGHKRVPRELLESHPIPLPPLDEQKRIVAILDEAFEGLDRARANAEANLQNARELFESFLRKAFDCCEIDWETEDLITNVRFIDYRGKTPPKTDTGIRLITAKNVKMGYIRRDPEEFIESDAYKDWMTRGFPEKGDVLFTTEAPLGNVAQLDTEETVVIGQRLITMQPDETAITRAFLKFALMAPQTQAEIQKRATGATVLGIKAKLLKTVPLTFPKSLEVQRKIAADCEMAFSAMVEAQSMFRTKLQNIDGLRQSLLLKAFAGELT